MNNAREAGREVAGESPAEHLLERRVEERTRELTALLDVSRSLTSMLELEPLIERILDQLQRVIDYRTAGVFLARDDALETVASRDTRSDAPRGRYLGHRRPLAQVAPIWERLCRGEPLLIGDVSRDDHPLAHAWRTATSSYRPELRSPAVRAWMAVPLSVRGQVVGYLALTREQPDGFTARDTDLALAFANQAAIAVHNARLYGQERRTAHELASLLEVSHNLGSTLELERLLDVILDQTKAVADFHGASLMTIDGDVTRTIRRRAPTEIDPAQTGVLPTPVHRAGPIGEMILRREPVIVDDVRGDSPLAHAYRRLASVPLETSHLRYVRSWMAVPMVTKDRVIGMIVLSRSEPNYYSERHASLVGAIATQAAAAIENARLYEQARALAVLSQAAASLTYDQSLGVTLDAMAAGVVQATGAVAASVMLLDGPDGSLRAAGTHGLPDDYMDAMERSWRAGAASRTLQALRAGQPSVVRGVREAALLNPDYAAAHPFLREVRWDTVAIQPLLYRDRVVGALNAYFLPESPPSVIDQSVLSAFANQATVAVENARLFDETERRVRELDALYRADEHLYRDLRLDAVLQALVDVAVDILPFDVSGLSIWDERDDATVLRFSRNLADTDVAHIRAYQRRRRSRRPAPTDGLAMIEDITIDRRLHEELKSVAGMRSVVEIPIVIGDQTFGTFSAGYRLPHRFSEDEQRMVMALAQRAAAAIENARLYEQAHKLAALEERQRLARELHDSVSQVLFSIGLGARTTRRLLDRDDAARAIPSVEYIAQLAEMGTAEMRALLFELRPESLEQEGLVAALAKQAAALRARHGIAVEATLCDEPPASLDAKEALYRIAQEATHNTVKHARASRIDIRLACDEEQVALEVVDDGVGFDASGSFPGHLGLVSMRERVARLGGTLTIDSAPGRGTVLRISIPAGGLAAS